MMLYCQTCQRLQEGPAEACRFCQGNALREPVPKDPVVVAQLPEQDAERLCAALSDAGISYDKETGGGVCTVLVPAGSCAEARDILCGMGLETGALPDEAMQSKESRRKQRLTRVVMFALLLLVIWGVVALSDAGLGFLKGLFSAG